MSATQQQIIEAITAQFTTTMGDTVYDVSGPYDEPTPVMTIEVLSDNTERAFPGQADNTAHVMTFTFNIWRQRKDGPAALRALGVTAFTLDSTRLPAASDGQNVIYCVDRGGVTVDDNNMLRLTQTWTYNGDF